MKINKKIKVLALSFYTIRIIYFGLNLIFRRGPFGNFIKLKP